LLLHILIFYPTSSSVVGRTLGLGLELGGEREKDV
jgi:hypothetical protein